ncbi:hypothetical protein [Mycobacterium hubeiense]|uniref:hypothetical protein n=1 Tax=Mycobacterium hubeiense TaxID=1867256 RepID=UPI000C7F09B6|nr:hypothetical protein [Mycobacterium sp. QGD 101]
MSETPDQPTTPVVTQTPPPAPRERSRLTAAAAWVGIVAGVVFIVAVVFFSGFVLGAHSGGGPRGHDRGHAVFHKVGPPPMGQFERGPHIFRGPDFERPDRPEPPQPPNAPTTTAPARP